ncbi:hypothetical protein ACFPJ4_00995 [Lysinimonas soli]|uniref:ATP-grasp domain-containing protein n=1 Tax=Lysinimonas soli TaxID=1074233 RepID=A0ABW0NM47_9MICO
MRFAEAAEGVCSLVWVIPPHGAREDRATLRFLGRLGDVVDVAAKSPADAVTAIRAQAPDGIVCFVDKHLRWTAEAAEMLDLAFHSRATADRLTDKLAQRTALRDHGLRTPGFWNVDELAEESVLRGAIDSGFPLVLKPRSGTSSRDTESIGDEDQLRAGVAASEPGRMLLEGYIPDPTTPQTGAGSAPYVSVELVVSRSIVSVLGITGRTPLAPPFRETGFLFPADVPPELADQLAATGVDAAVALGVSDGALHVEIKCTDDGPVVIEVNGRPGGHAVHPLLRRALGIDTVRLAMRVAVGEDVVLGALPSPDEVVFRFDVQPDVGLRTITAVEGLDVVVQIPGVEQVIQGLGPGDAFSWRNGTLGYAAAVLGAAPDHQAARRIRNEVLERVVISGMP